MRASMLVVALLALPAGAMAQTPVPAAVTGTAAPTRGKDATERVERYITDLYRRLSIKPAQQGQWDAFAAAMRANAARQEAEYNARTTRTMTAVEDLKAYADSERARAADVDKLVPPFEALYGAMDPAQRANADKVFQDVQKRRSR